MGAKVKVTRELIVKGAVALIRKQGHSVLTARNLAVEIGCSTQPLYRVAANIEEILESAGTEAEQIALKFILNNKDGDCSFLSIGLGYMEFARQEPNLFKFLFMSGRKNHLNSLTDSLNSEMLEKMRTDKFLADFSDEVLKELLRDMWIYSHGICTAFYVGFIREEESTLYRELLEETGFKLITYQTLKKGGIIREDEIKGRLCKK